MENNFLTDADGYLKSKDFKGAEESYKKALEADSKSATAYLGLYLCQVGFISLDETYENADCATLLGVSKNKNFIKAQKFAHQGLKAALLKFAETSREKGAGLKAKETEEKRLEEEAKKRAKEIGRYYELEEARIISCKKAVAAPPFYKETCEIGDRVFEGKSAIKKLSLPENITYVGDSAFAGCKNLEEVTLARAPEEMGDCVFENCVNLNSVIFPNDLRAIKRRTFYNCGGLENIKLPAELKTIGESAFDGCFGLTGIKIPEKVEKIGDYAFYGCEGIEILSIPQSVREIGKSAFERCQLKKVTMPKRFKKRRKKIFGKKMGGLFSKVEFGYI